MASKFNTYVGMRYVPKFEGDWSDSIEYEPLCVVYYQGNSYTSKSYVPAGTLPTNTTYWALTGNYNAQIEQYRLEVEHIKDELDSIVPQSKTYLFIGDSYGTYPGSWIDSCAEELGLDSTKYQKIAQGGAGFSAQSSSENKNFTALLGDATLKNVTDIVVCGGANDYSHLDTLLNDIQTFITTANLKYPKVKIHVGFIGRTQVVEDTFAYGKAECIYKKCVLFGARYITNSEVCMRVENAFADEYVHPTEEVNRNIGKYIATYLLGGTINIANWNTLELLPGVTGTLYYTQENNKIRVFSTGNVQFTETEFYNPICDFSSFLAVGNRYQETIGIATTDKGESVNIYINTAKQLSSRLLPRPSTPVILVNIGIEFYCNFM